MTKLALCIGINDYPGTGSDLAGCVNDARDWGGVFQAREYTVSYLLDGAATGKAMRKALLKILGEASSGDSVIIQYSGHGSFVADKDGDEPDGTDECLCPYDVQTNGPITDDELSEIYASRAAGVKLAVISDSCHSGTVAKFAPIQTPPTVVGKKAPQRKVRFLPPATFLPARQVTGMGPRLRRAASPPGRHEALLMAGCQDSEYSYDAWFQGRPNGAFTFVAIQTLSKLPKSATYQRWYDEIRKVLPSQQYPQIPNLYGTSSMKQWPLFS